MNHRDELVAVLAKHRAGGYFAATSWRPMSPTRHTSLMHSSRRAGDMARRLLYLGGAGARPGYPRLVGKLLVIPLTGVRTPRKVYDMNTNTETQTSSRFTTSFQGDGTVCIMDGNIIVIRTSPAKLAETLAHVERVRA